MFVVRWIDHTYFTCSAIYPVQIYGAQNYDALLTCLFCPSYHRYIFKSSRDISLQWTSRSLLERNCTNRTKQQWFVGGLNLISLCIYFRFRQSFLQIFSIIFNRNKQSNQFDKAMQQRCESWTDFLKDYRHSKCLMPTKVQHKSVAFVPYSKTR